MTAVIRPALALLAASIMIKSSIRLSLTGADVDWMMNKSLPRTVSSMCTLISPSLNWPTSMPPSSVFNFLAIASARGRLELPAKSLISLP